VGLTDRAINTAERTTARHDFSLRYLTPFGVQFADAAKQQDVDVALLYGIARQESRFVADVVSSAGAVGLMQLKPSTSGRDVYRRMGWRGEPSVSELKNPERNISMGAAYLSILENGPLAGIKDPQVMRYAVVVSYANGAGALLRTFSSDRQDAIDEINDLDADEFFEHVVKKHPAPQAPRYIWKLQKALDAM